MGFELLVRCVLSLSSVPARRNIKFWGDNKGVVEGWWNARSRNSAVNEVFQRLHTLLEETDCEGCIFTAYVLSASNPADAPSRGKYAPTSLLLPPVDLPSDVADFLVDATYPPTSAELAAIRAGGIQPPIAKPAPEPAYPERQVFNSHRFCDALTPAVDVVYTDEDC